MRYALVLLSGGAIGAVVCLVLGMGWAAAAIGALVGGAVSFLAYDWEEVRRTAPWVARRAFAEVRTQGALLSAKLRDVIAFLVRFIIAPRVFVWIWSIVGSFVLWVGGTETFGEKLDSPPFFFMVVLFVCLAFLTHACVLCMSLVVSSKGDHNPDELFLLLIGDTCFSDHVEYFTVAREQWSTYWRTWGVILTVYWQGLVFLARGSFRLAAMVMRVLFLAMLAAPSFCWKLFVAIHSEERRMAFVDSALGMFAGYAGLRIAYGDAFLSMPPSAKFVFVALCATSAFALGMANCHLVARHVLKLEPVKTRS